jgi:hypothetical protein
VSKQAIKRINQKLTLASRRIAELDAAIHSFIADNQMIIVKELNHDGTAEIWCFRLKDDDLSHLSTLAFEIGHSLRSALDNIVCEVALKHSGRNNRTYFPFSKLGPEGLEAEIKQKCRDIPDNLIEYIQELQPFKGGDHLLWGLHDMNRADKHAGIEVIGTRSGWMIGSDVVRNGRIFVLGSFNGQHLITGPDTHRLPFEVAHPGEFMTTTLGAEVAFETLQAEWHISFVAAYGYGRESVVSSLSSTAERVKTIVDHIAQTYL